MKIFVHCSFKKKNNIWARLPNAKLIKIIYNRTILKFTASFSSSTVFGIKLHKQTPIFCKTYKLIISISNKQQNNYNYIILIYMCNNYAKANDFFIKWSNGIIWRQFLFRKKNINKITNGTAAADQTLQTVDRECFTVMVLSQHDVMWYNAFNTTQNSHNILNVLILYSTALCCALLDYVIILSSLKKWWTEQGVESDLCSAMRDRGSFLDQRPRCVLRSQGVLWWTAVTLELKKPVLWKIVLGHFRWPF